MKRPLARRPTCGDHEEPSVRRGRAHSGGRAVASPCDASDRQGGLRMCLRRGSSRCCWNSCPISAVLMSRTGTWTRRETLSGRLRRGSTFWRPGLSRCGRTEKLISIRLPGTPVGGTDPVLESYRGRLSSRRGRHAGKWAVNRDPRDCHEVYFEDPERPGLRHVLSWNGLPPGEDVPAFSEYTRTRSAPRGGPLRPQAA